MIALPIIFCAILLAFTSITETLCSAHDKHDGDLYRTFTPKVHKHIIGWLQKKELAQYFTEDNVTIIQHPTKNRRPEEHSLSILMKIPIKEWDAYVSKLHPPYAAAPSLLTPILKSIQWGLIGMIGGVGLGRTFGTSPSNNGNTNDIEVSFALTGGLVGVLLGGLYGFHKAAEETEQAITKKLAENGLHLSDGDCYTFAIEEDSVTLDLKEVVREVIEVQRSEH